MVLIKVTPHFSADKSFVMFWRNDYTKTGIDRRDIPLKRQLIRITRKAFKLSNYKDSVTSSSC